MSPSALICARKASAPFETAIVVVFSAIEDPLPAKDILFLDSTSPLLGAVGNPMVPLPCSSKAVSSTGPPSHHREFPRGFSRSRRQCDTPAHREIFCAPRSASH